MNLSRSYTDIFPDVMESLPIENKEKVQTAIQIYMNREQKVSQKTNLKLDVTQFDE